jgi:AcrR family transcriptional regulator
MMVGAVDEPGRRERKKQRTREALIEAAFELFQAKGFEATTVEEIADAVDVSSRTFFRYFASKEDLPLTVQEEQFAAMMEALEARPPEEPVLTALRNATVSIARATERGELSFDAAWAQCVIEMMSQSPAIMARSLEHAQKKQADLTRVISARMGVDPDKDLRPHIAAAMSACAFQAVAEMARKRDKRFQNLSEAVDAAFAIIEGGLNFPSKPSS